MANDLINETVTSLVVFVVSLLSDAVCREWARVKIQSQMNWSNRRKTSTLTPSRLENVNVSYLIKEFDFIYTKSSDSSYLAFLGQACNGISYFIFTSNLSFKLLACDSSVIISDDRIDVFRPVIF